MSDAHFEQLRRLIHACFPDNYSTLSIVTDAMVDRFVEADWRHGFLSKVQRAALGIPALPASLPAPAPPVLDSGPQVLGYYTGNAFHVRRRPGGTSHEFTARLPMVRARLAKTDRTAIQTAIGILDRSTTLYLTVDDWNARLCGEPGFVRAEEVHVIAPARMDGERFGAVGAYLAYTRAGDAVPHAYLLEAGLAQGGPGVPFYGRTMDTIIVAQSNYQPTPFARRTHWYQGRLDVVANEPTSLAIGVFVDAGLTEQYVSVAMRFAPETATSVSKINPSVIRIEAALRVAAIAEAIGVDIGVPAFAQSIMAAAGRAAPIWAKVPRREDG